MLNKIQYFFRQSWLLIVATFFYALLVVVVNSGLSSQIEANRINKLNNLMKGLITQAEVFEKVIEELEVTDSHGRAVETAVFKALDSEGKLQGFAFIASGTGFADKIELVVALDGRCEHFLGYAVLSSNETPGFGDRIKNDYYRSQFSGAPVGILKLVKTGGAGSVDEEIVAISGATVSSRSVVEIINDFTKEVKRAITREGLSI